MACCSGDEELAPKKVTEANLIEQTGISSTSEEIPDAITDKSTTNASNANGDVLKSEDTLELNIPLPKDIPDARPSADPSEVDAKPLSWSRECAPPTALSVPTARDSLSYNLSGLKRVLIFNQKNFASRLKLNPRNGTEVDVKSIESTFKSLDWSVTTYTDSTVAQIRDIILKEVQLSEQEVSALAIFILSHGEDNGTIFASDYPFRVDHDILGQLTADKCPRLVGRPKLLFVQACQGQATDQGVNVTDRRRRHTSQDNTATYKIPNYADFLIFQASFWDHFSFRSSETGSWFIQALCDKIDRSHPTDPLFDVLLEVSAQVALNKESNVPGRPNLDKKKQVPLLYSTMLRKLYLKGPNNPSQAGLDSPSRDSIAIADAFAGLKVEEQRTRSQSRSSRRSSKDKDCKIM